MTFHSLPPEDVLRKLDARCSGLTQAEAAQRIATFGQNILEAQARVSALQRFFSQFHNVFVYVLLVSAVIMLVFRHYTDAIIIFAVLLINAVIGFFQERKAEQAIAAIKQLLSESALALRDGKQVKLPSSQVVPGDIVMLEAGERVPADIRLLEANDLHIQEAILTGESESVLKNTDVYPPHTPLAEIRCMAYAGTHVVRGKGLGVVVRTAANTEVGKIGKKLPSLDAGHTPLQRTLDQFANRFCLIILALCALVYGIGVWLRNFSHQDMLFSVIGIAVSAIPEGLPAIMSITLAIGMRRMASRNAIIRSLPSVETLGSVDVICTDKTGTLTHNELAIAHVMTADHLIDVAGAGYAPHGQLNIRDQDVTIHTNHQIRILSHAAALNNDAELRELEHGWEMIGDPTEGALLCFAMKAGRDVGITRGRHKRQAGIPFDATRKYMATLHEIEGIKTIYIKGAPEVILPMCAGQLMITGATAPIDTPFWNRSTTDLASRGERVLALARIEYSENLDDLNNATLLGLLGIIDRPREEAKGAIAECRDAGIRIKMITGDHPVTASAIARQLGLENPDAILTGPEMDQMGDALLAKAIEHTSVFARTTPDQKLRIVNSLRQFGHIVAMTGDGVNDALSLKQSDIGIAMGQGGSALARESSKMVLADNNFASIVAAIEEGRTVYDNLKKSIRFMLTTDVAEAMTIVTAVILGFALPLLPGQILWVNTVTAVTLSLAMAFDPKSPGIMRRRPRSRDAAFYHKKEIAGSVAMLMVISGVTLFSFHAALGAGRSIEYARTLAVTMLVFAQISFLFSMRIQFQKRMLSTSIAEGKVAFAAAVITIILQLTFIYLPASEQIFSAAPLTLGDLGIIGLLCLGLFFLFASIEWLIKP